MNDSILLERAYLKIYENVEIGVGKNFKAFDIGNNQVRKVPINGGKISEKEYKKLQFMKANESTGAFVKIFKLTPDEVVTEKVILINKMLFKWAKESCDETNDIDILSDWVHQLFSNRQNYAASIQWLDELIEDKDSWYDDDATAVRGFLSDRDKFAVIHQVSSLLKKLANIVNWPAVVDIHANNVGISNEQLVVFDM